MRADDARLDGLDRRDGLAAPLLLGYAVAMVYPLVFLGRALVDYDAFVYFYPQRAYLAQSLAEGRLPLWNPYLFMGAPFLANPQTSVLYPPSWLFLLGPLTAAYTIQVVLHTFLGALFTYLLARLALDTGRLAAGVGALAYGFGGFAVGQAGHLNQLSAAAWLPAMLLAYDRAARLGSPRWAALGGVALGLQVLAGHPQESYMSVVVVALYAAARAPWRSARGLLWWAGAGGLMGLVGGLLAAPQVLASLELAPLSIRAAGVQWDDAVAGSLPSYLVPRSLFPPYWLDVASTEYLGYVGVVPVALAFLALVVVRSRAVLFGALLWLLALFLAPGQNNGNYWLFFAYVPGFDTFRVPARWLFLWGAGASVLAALGAEWVSRGAWVSLRRRDLWPRILLVALVLAAGLAWQRDAGEPFDQRRTPLLYLALAGAALGAGALASLGPRRWATTLLVGLTAAELWAAADWSPSRQSPPADLLVAVPAAVQALQAQPGPAGRVLSVAQPGYFPADEGAVRARLAGQPERLTQALLVANKWRETLTPNVPLLDRVRSVDGYDGGALPLLSFLRFSGLLVPPPAEARPDGVLTSRVEQAPPERLLDLAGISDVLANVDDPAVPGARVAQLGDLALYTRDAPAPMSSLVFRAGVAAEADALQRLAQPTFDPRRELLLAPDPRVQPLLGTQPPIAVVGTQLSPERWRARVSVPARAYLLQREAWYPGWKARVDGAPAPLLRADVLFRAVLLEPGEREVELSFEPDYLAPGVAMAVLGAALAGGLLTWPLWRARLLGR